MQILSTLLATAMAFSAIAAAAPAPDGPGGFGPPPQRDQFYLKIQGRSRYNGQYVGWEASRRDPRNLRVVPVDGRNRDRILDHSVGRRAGNLHAEVKDRNNVDRYDWQFSRRRGGPGQGNNDDFDTIDLVPSSRGSSNGASGFSISQGRDAFLEINRSSRDWAVCEWQGRQGTKHVEIARITSRRGPPRECDSVDLVVERHR
ncbi:hypothetical protein TWF696_002656 [Orbilia brochopaga]|uniref:Secreted protein n=1 Tax=Orbilia brochopaga TaxID=3140254 RepID=A0AAV9U4Z6_9PEZI